MPKKIIWMMRYCAGGLVRVKAGGDRVTNWVACYNYPRSLRNRVGTASP